ncbi:c4-dicarboxylate transporter malic acid transport [Apodospora peruviana]|uniref:C4-dicarboxylate transporter malic acid transport n=1 Tax=Apodospora peruviana TaxID=516989 RepID=A0AAE0HUY9_9PEZI|nr:c4-dicarboxylate transporter malic acid transport [Apodospora peruviana]
MGPSTSAAAAIAGGVTGGVTPAAAAYAAAAGRRKSEVPTEYDGATSTPGPPRNILERIPTYLQPSLPWRRRLLHFTFAWYTLTMSTSGIALLLALTPHRFPGLDYIGLVIFLLDLLFFAFITVAIALRFALYKDALVHAFTHPGEALFVPTFWLSIAAILSNVSEYSRMFLPAEGGNTLADFMEITFWIYLAVTFASSVFQYHMLFTVKEERRLQVSTMTPAWILPIFPVMLAGTLAGAASKLQSPEHSVSILCAGLAAQGLGFWVSVFFYSTYLSRLMAFGLPVQRPGMFIAVGPPSFTCAALVGMANRVPEVFKALTDSQQIRYLSEHGDQETLAAGIRLLALNVGIFFWGVSFWFFVSAMAAVVASGMPDRRFHLSWWSFVFPNVGFVISTIRIGSALSSEGLLWMSTVMTALLFLAWAFIAIRCAMAVRKREIMWPGHDEDST